MFPWVWLAPVLFVSYLVIAGAVAQWDSADGELEGEDIFIALGWPVILICILVCAPFFFSFILGAEAVKLPEKQAKRKLAAEKARQLETEKRKADIDRLEKQNRIGPYSDDTTSASSADS